MRLLRTITIFGIIVPITGVLMPVQYFAVKLNRPLARRIPGVFHRLVCRLLGVRVHVHGQPVTDRPLLITPNHVSWLDIPIISTVLPVSFIAKAEVAGWPVFGTLARLQRTVFVNRERRSATGAVASEIADRLDRGDAMVLFPEGTSGDGNFILPFRSALLGAAREAISRGNSERVWVQPMSLVYSKVQGLPMGRQFRPMAAWYGDMDMLPHLMGIVREGVFDVDVFWGEPIVYDPQSDRKAVAALAETAVRTLTAAALRGRHEEVRPHREIAAEVQ